MRVMRRTMARAPTEGALSFTPAEISAAVADLGTILPITAALVLINGLDPVAAIGLAGALFVAAGLVYRVPIPVQPIKAAAAIAIATHASAEVIAAAGLVIGVVLVLLAVTKAAAWLARIFPKPMIRGNQLGVGILLLLTAARLVSDEGGLAIALAGAMTLVLAVTSGRRIPAAVAFVAGGVALTLVQGTDGGALGPQPALPSFDLPGTGALLTAFTLLVIPQLPLTLSNAVVGVDDLAHDLYGERARRVSPTRLCASSGLANVVVGLLGGMPLCHGSSGLTAYHRLGARTGGTTIVLGGVLVGVGLLFGTSAPALFALIPVPVLAALLAYTGIRHAGLVTDQRGWPLVVALAMGAVGGATGNLTWAMAVGGPAYVVFAVVRAKRQRAGSASTR